MTDTHTETIAERFARETRDHEMTILHDDGLYRHLRFAKPGTSLYQFEVSTTPGTLTFYGDGESFVFRCTTDMIDFFRMAGTLYPVIDELDYLGQKVTSSRVGLRRYDEDRLKTQVMEAFAEAVQDEIVPASTEQALQEDVFDALSIEFEHEARRIVEDFNNRHHGFLDGVLSDWDVHGWYWWFAWACHAIVWGVRQYDNVTTDDQLPAAVPAAPSQA